MYKKDSLIYLNNDLYFVYSNYSFRELIFSSVSEKDKHYTRYHFNITFNDVLLDNKPSFVKEEVIKIFSKGLRK